MEVLEKLLIFILAKNKYNMSVNKTILNKGLRVLLGSLPTLFLGVFILNSSFKNQNHPLFIYVAILGIIICGFSVYLMFKGINTIMKSMFEK
jgi:small neutral amino acid transporter SnatA (MarC family)